MGEDRKKPLLSEYRRDSYGPENLDKDKRIQNVSTTYFDVSASEITKGIEEWNKIAFPMLAEG